MNYSTYSVKPTKMVATLLESLPLLLKNEKQICSSYLTYNTDTGCYFISPDGERYPLFLGRLLDLWRHKGSQWHFYDKGNYEVFTYNIKQFGDKELLCWCWDIRLKEVNVFVIKDDTPNKTFTEMNEILTSVKHPKRDAQKFEDWVYTLQSVYDVSDLVESLEKNVPISSVFEKRYKKYASFYSGGTYLYPSKNKKTDFCVKTFDSNES